MVRICENVSSRARRTEQMTRIIGVDGTCSVDIQGLTSDLGRLICGQHVPARCAERTVAGLRRRSNSLRMAARPDSYELSPCTVSQSAMAARVCTL